MSTPDELELDALLSRSGRVHSAWREASVEQPPAALDDAIRAAARRAVHAGPRVAGGSFVSRWRVPMSIAAVLVVSATLTLLLSERGEHLPGADLRGAPAALEAPSEADAAARDAAKAADGDERLRTAPSLADAAPARKLESAPIAGVSGPVAEQPEAIAPGGRQLTKQSAPRQPEAFPGPQKPKPVQQGIEPAEQEAKIAQQHAEPVQRESAPAARRDARAPAAAQAEAVAALEARAKAQTQAGELADRAVPPAPQVVAARAPAEASGAAANQTARAAPAAAAALPAEPAAPAGEGRTAGLAEGAAPEGAESSKRDAPAPSRAEAHATQSPATSEVARRRASAAEVESARAQREFSATGKREAQQAAVAPALDPKAWVERMLALQREGRVPEAQRSLQEFRRLHPDYPLPPELAALLKAPVADPRSPGAD